MLSARKSRKEALLTQSTGPTAHVAGAGTRVRGLRPSDTTQASSANASLSRGAWGVTPNGGRRFACALWALARSAKRTGGVNRNERGARQCPARRLRLRGTLGRCPTPRQGTQSPAPRYWGFAPRGYEFGGLSLLWPCVPIWGYAPKPRARGLNTNKIKICSDRAVPL